MLKQTIVLLFLTGVFGMSASVSADMLSLDDYLALVKRHSRELKMAARDVETAQAQKREAISGALPHINAAAGYTRNLSETYMYVDLGEGTQQLRVNHDNDYQAQVALTQTLFSLNVKNAITAADQFQKLTDFVYGASYQEIITASKKLFYQTILARTVWRVTDSSEQNAHENYLNVKAGFDNGLVSEFALLQAEVNWRDMIPQTIRAQRDLELALVNLKSLAGMNLDRDIEPEGDLATIPGQPVTRPFDSVLGARPDYNALLWEEKLRSTNVAAERAAYYPSLQGRLAYGYSASSNEWSLDNENNSWTAGVSLSIPIFNGGATRAKVAQALIDRDKTRLQIDQTRDDIQKEMTSIRLRLAESSRRIESVRATVATAAKAYSIAQSSAVSGLATQLELKNARLASDQAQLAYHAAVYDYLAAWFDWEKATGQLTASTVEGED
ncbi:MAG: TolC family protein [candidate division Zixibacteria bacterium]|nr:TolC family protein [candidate division Zixibacteria bacterium]